MTHRTRTRGYTLIELAVIVAVVGVLSAVAIGYQRSGLSDANLSSAANDLALQLGGLRSTAMRDGKDYLVVVVDAPGSDGSGCRGKVSQCATVFTLRDPQPGWSVGSFDAATPGNDAAVVDYTTLPRGVHFDLGSTATPPAPFDVAPFGADVQASCNGRACVAFRFTPVGEVKPVFARDTTNHPRGVTLALAAALAPGTPGNDRRLVFVSFPTAMVRNVVY